MIRQKEQANREDYLFKLLENQQEYRSKSQRKSRFFIKGADFLGLIILSSGLKSGFDIQLRRDYKISVQHKINSVGLKV